MSNKPVIGLVLVEGRKSNPMYIENLQKSSPECEVRSINVQQIMDEFKELYADDYAKLREQYPAKSKDVDGVVKAPNIEVETPQEDIVPAMMDIEKGPGAKLKEFVANHKSVKGINGIAGPGDLFNAVEPGISENPDRMYFEKALYSVVNDKGIPSLGVCGTEQHVAHFLGAEIVNDVNERTGHDHYKNIEGTKSGHVHSHEIIIDKDSMLFGYLPKKMRDSVSRDEYRIPVNSLHSQAVLASEDNRKTLDKAGYEISALDPTKKIVEGFSSKNGVHEYMQFHPEFDNDEFERNILNGLSTKAKTNFNKHTVTEQIKEQSMDGLAISRLKHVAEEETGERKQKIFSEAFVKEQYLRDRYGNKSDDTTIGSKRSHDEREDHNSKADGNSFTKQMVEKLSKKAKTDIPKKSSSAVEKIVSNPERSRKM